MSGEPPTLVDQLARDLLDPTRLGIVAMLAAAGEVEFGFLRDHLALTDSALSKQLRTLADADLVTLVKHRAGTRHRTWARLTPDGRDVFVRHINALRDIAARASAPSDSSDV